MKALSLFAGAGGLDMGFERAGFDIIWANDINKDACETHRRWSDAIVVNKSIDQIPIDSLPQVGMILGGFPCQGFSLAGPRKVDDSRNLLYRFYVNAVNEKKPDVFVAENVKGILTLGDGEILKKIKRDFETAGDGYDVSVHVLNASEYGVAQDRVRVFIIGFNRNLKLSKPFDIDSTHREEVVLKDILDRASRFEEKDLCLAPYSPRYMSRNRKRAWDNFSYTIPAMAKQVAIHPSSPDMVKISNNEWRFGDGLTRRLTWREASLVQSFPADLEFYGNLLSKYRQVGNAVPVRLAEKIGLMVKDHLK